jgi:hypothetical protein
MNFCEVLYINVKEEISLSKVYAQKNGPKLISFVINCVVHYRTPLVTCIDLSTMGTCHVKRILLFKKIIEEVDKFGNFEKNVFNKCYLC